MSKKNKNKNQGYTPLYPDARHTIIRKDMEYTTEGKARITGHWATRQITVNGAVVTNEESRKARDYGSDVHVWGEHSDAVKQTALAILLEAKDPEALVMFKYFAAQVLANLPQADFEIFHGDTGK